MAVQCWWCGGGDDAAEMKGRCCGGGDAVHVRIKIMRKCC